MKVLVVGNGAREHAMAKSLAGDDVELYAAMSSRNPGIAKLAAQTEIMDINDPRGYGRFQGVDIAFIGPETPLSSGVVDHLNEMGIPAFGPTRALAKIEWSKAFARSFLEDYCIDGNPDFSVCRNLDDVRQFLKGHTDVAVKPDVLTGGKGVKLTGEHLNSVADIEAYAAERIRSDSLVVLEEKLVGREFTLQAFTDGNGIEVMPLVRDYKRAYDGDKGPNTGSMGSYSCPDHNLPDLPLSAIKKGTDIMNRTIRALSSSVGKFRGVLYGGFMNTKKGVYLLEYNARFGDPEALNVLALLKTPLLKIGWDIVNERLGAASFENRATVCVYVVPKGYPDKPRRGEPIEIGKIRRSELFYASVHEEGGVIRTTSSRSVALIAKGKSITEARDNVYSDVPKIKGALFYRRDIAEVV